MNAEDWRRNAGGDTAKHCYCVIIRSEEYPTGNNEVCIHTVPTIEGARKMIPGETLTPVTGKRPESWMIAGAYVADWENQTEKEFADSHANIPARKFFPAGLLDMAPTYDQVYMPMGDKGPLYPLESGMFYCVKRDDKDCFLRVSFQPEKGEHFLMLFGVPFFYRLYGGQIVLRDRFAREADKGQFDAKRLNLKWPEDDLWPDESYTELTKYLEESGMINKLKNIYKQNSFKQLHYYEDIFRESWYVAVAGQLDTVSHRAAKAAVVKYLQPPDSPSDKA